MVRKVITEDGELLPAEPDCMLKVTRAEILACIARHEETLTHLIRDPAGPPSDAAIYPIRMAIVELRKILAEIE